MNSFFKIIFVILIVCSNLKAQITETFDTFTLSPNSFYQDNTGADWKSSLTTPISFEYGNKNGEWSSGSVYTNIKDTTDLSNANILACASYNSFNGNNYATVKDSATIYLANDEYVINRVSGFFITNTTYVKNILKNGGNGCRKFGDTTGTGWGSSIAQGSYPDWLKLTVCGFYKGLPCQNTVSIYLADYRFSNSASDYIVSDWRYINCVNIGMVDSLKLFLSSSDNAIGKMKTPGYFCIDNFTTTNIVGVQELKSIVNINLSPNPAADNMYLTYTAMFETDLTISIVDISGKQVYSASDRNIKNGENKLHINTEDLEAGIYFLNITEGNTSKRLKFIKL